MDWLKKNFDRVILAIIGLAVAAFAVMIVLNVLSFGEIFESQNSTRKPNNTLPAPPTAQVEAEASAITHPATWGTHEGSLFVSEPYIDRGNGPINPLNDSEPLFPPITNQWLMENGLALEANLLDADPDGDKFTNLEEFNGKTDPNNPKSKPGYITKLRLKEMVKIPFRLKFSGSPDDGETFSINTLDLNQPTLFLPMGAEVTGTPYKILEYNPKTEDKNGLEVNVSELVLENQETGQKITLIYDQVVDEPTVYADFRYLWDGSEFRVKMNETFSVKPEEDVKYKLIDINESQALIENVQNKEQITVLKENS